MCFRSYTLNLLRLVQRGAMLASSKEQSGQYVCATEPAIESWTAQQRDDARDRKGDVVAGTVAERRNDQEHENRDDQRHPRNPQEKLRLALRRHWSNEKEISESLRGARLI